MELNRKSYPSPTAYAEAQGVNYVTIMRRYAEATAANLRARAQAYIFVACEWDDGEIELRIEQDLEDCVATYDEMDADELRRVLCGIHDRLQEEFNELVVNPAQWYADNVMSSRHEAE